MATPTPPPPRNLISLRLDEAYRQLLQNLDGEAIPTLIFHRHSTRSAIAKVLTESLADDQTSVWFRRPPPPRNPQRFESGPGPTNAATTQPILAARTEPLPPLKRQSAGRREDLRKLARETVYYGPPFRTDRPGTSVQGGYVPTARGSLGLEGLNSDKDGMGPGQK